jgi:hypothetical protein
MVDISTIGTPNILYVIGISLDSDIGMNSGNDV